MTQTKFEQTKVMSTYLLAIIVCDFANISAIQGHTLVKHRQIYRLFFFNFYSDRMVKSEVLFLCLQIRIWARRTAIQLGQGDYALRVTGPVLQFFQSYYNISYPLSKSGRSRLNSSDLRMSQSKDN